MKKNLFVSLLATLALNAPGTTHALPPTGGDPSTGKKPEVSDAAQPSVAAGIYVYFDAQEAITKLRQPTPDIKGIWDILKPNGITKDNYANNPFLKQVKALNPEQKINVAPVPAGGATVGAQASSPLALFTPSGVADALGTFIAERFKQEAEIVAVQELAARMKKLDALDARYNKPLSSLLPRSMQLLNATDPDAIDQSAWTTLQTDFKADLKALPANLSPFLDSLYPPKTSITPTRYFINLGTNTAAAIISTGQKPYNIIDAVGKQSSRYRESNTDYFPEGLIRADVALKAIAIASHMLSLDHGHQWASESDIKKLVFTSEGSIDQDAINILLGISWAHDADLYKGIDAWLEAAKMAELKSIATDLGKLTNFANGLVALAPQLEKIKEDVDAFPSSKATATDAIPLIQDVGGLATAIVKAVATYDSSLKADVYTDEIKLVQNDLVALAEIISDAKDANYAGVVAGLINVLPTILPKDRTDSTSLVFFVERDGQFIAALAQAKSATDLNAALQTYALPPGSYTKLQKEDASFTLNSYFGVSASAEALIGDLSGTKNTRIRPRVGFTAPVGFAYNWGNIKPAGSGEKSSGSEKFFTTGSWSVFVPILDVGAVASWRLGKGSGQVSSLEWSNILAPGIYGVWTKKGRPYSIMFGTQYGPALRKVSTTAGNTIERAAWQIPSFGITFNMPIFSFYEKTGSKP